MEHVESGIEAAAIANHRFERIQANGLYATVDVVYADVEGRRSPRWHARRNNGSGKSRPGQHDLYL